MNYVILNREIFIYDRSETNPRFSLVIRIAANWLRQLTRGIEMSKLKYLVPIVALSLPISVVADSTGGVGRSDDYMACKSAMKKHFEFPRMVDVKKIYWISDQVGSDKRMLLNAKFNGQVVRGTCDLSRKGRVAELTVKPGRFVGQDNAVEFVQLIR